MILFWNHKEREVYNNFNEGTFTYDQPFELVNYLKGKNINQFPLFNLTPSIEYYTDGGAFGPKGHFLVQHIDLIPTNDNYVIVNFKIIGKDRNNIQLSDLSKLGHEILNTFRGASLVHLYAHQISVLFPEFRSKNKDDFSNSLVLISSRISQLIVKILNSYNIWANPDIYNSLNKNKIFDTLRSINFQSRQKDQECKSVLVFRNKDNNIKVDISKNINFTLYDIEKY